MYIDSPDKIQTVYASETYKNTYSIFLIYVPAVHWTAMWVFNDIYILTETFLYIKSPVCILCMFYLCKIYSLTWVGCNPRSYTNLWLDILPDERHICTVY